MHQSKRYGASWGEVSSYESGSHHQAEIKSGIETFFMENFSGYVQISPAWGGDDYRVLSGSVGLKLRW